MFPKTQGKTHYLASKNLGGRHGKERTSRATHRNLMKQHVRCRDKHTKETYKQAGKPVNTPPHPTLGKSEEKHLNPDIQEHTQDTRARTAQEHCTRVAQRWRLPKDSAPSGGDKDDRPPDNLRASFPGDTHRVNRGDQAGSGEAGPAEAEPTAKQPRVWHRLRLG